MNLCTCIASVAGHDFRNTVFFAAFGFPVALRLSSFPPPTSHLVSSEGAVQQTPVSGKGKQQTVWEEEPFPAFLFLKFQALPCHMVELRNFKFRIHDDYNFPNPVCPFA